MLWIHGGAGKLGFAQQYPYNVAIRNFISRDVVVVTIQYRLGVLGKAYVSHTENCRLLQF